MTSSAKPVSFAILLRTLCALLIAAGAAALVPGCGGGASSDRHAKTRTLTVGYAFGFDVGDAGDRVALRRIAGRTNLRFRFQDMGGPSNALAALIRGDIALANVSYGVLLAAIASGAPVQALVASNAVPEYQLVAGAGIHTVRDLRGKRIAHSGPGIELETLVQPALAAAGLKVSDVKQSVILDSPQKAAALTSGRVDAASLDEVTFERLRARNPAYHVLARTATFEPAEITLWAVSKRFVDSNQSLVRNLERDLIGEYGFLYTDAGERAWTAEARSTFMSGDPPALVRRVYRFYRQIRVWPTRREILTKKQHQHFLSALRGSGVVERPVSFAQVWGPG